MTFIEFQSGNFTALRLWRLDDKCFYINERLRLRLDDKFSLNSQFCFTIRKIQICFLIIYDATVEFGEN